MNGKVIWCDDLGLNDLQVLPLTEPNVLWTEEVGEEEGEGGREEVPSQVTHEYLILTQWYGSMTMKL